VSSLILEPKGVLILLPKAFKLRMVLRLKCLFKSN